MVDIIKCFMKYSIFLCVGRTFQYFENSEPKLFPLSWGKHGRRHSLNDTFCHFVSEISKEQLMISWKSHHHVSVVLKTSAKLWFVNCLKSRFSIARVSCAITLTDHQCNNFILTKQYFILTINRWWHVLIRNKQFIITAC